MEEAKQKFLEAEETAQRLVESLKRLHSEASSYQTATEELNAVRQRLAALIESTKELVVGSHDVVTTLKEVGGPEILSGIGGLEDQARSEFAAQSRLVQKLKTFVIITLAASVIGIAVGIIGLLR